MRTVCLILPAVSADSISSAWVSRCRARIEAAGYALSVVAVFDGSTPVPDSKADGVDRVSRATGPGLTRCVFEGLADARADLFLVVDPTQGIVPEDVAPVLASIVVESSGVVVGRRVGQVSRGGPLTTLLGKLAGVSDPFSGLFAVDPVTAHAVADAYHPVGTRYTIDLLFRSRVPRREVDVRVEGVPSRKALTVNDLRQIKRLADDRFGNASRLIQFCAVGASGMAVDLTCYALFQLLFRRTWLSGGTVPVTGAPLDLAVAAILAITIALTWNFSLNRRLTFSYAREGSFLRQYATYAVSNALGIVLSLFLRLYLPAHVEFFRLHKLAAAVVGIVTATGISFSLARWVVFGKRKAKPTTASRSDQVDVPVTDAVGAGLPSD